MTSHVMRHTYAVAMLSGSWGYEPVGLEFVSKQLGHSSQQTTERYYGAFEAGTWTREVRRFTGRTGARSAQDGVTAAELLALCSVVPQMGILSGGTPLWGQVPSSTPKPENQTQFVLVDGALLKQLAALSRQHLKLTEDNSAAAWPAGIRVSELGLELERSVVAAREADSA